MVVGRKQIGIAVGDIGTYDPHNKTIRAITNAKVTLHSFYNNREVTGTTNEAGKVVLNIDNLCSSRPAEVDERTDSEGKQLDYRFLAASPSRATAIATWTIQMLIVVVPAYFTFELGAQLSAALKFALTSDAGANPAGIIKNITYHPGDSGHTIALTISVGVSFGSSSAAVAASRPLPTAIAQLWNPSTWVTATNSGIYRRRTKPMRAATRTSTSVAKTCTITIFRPLYR